jgi:hypothetical protein
MRRRLERPQKGNPRQLTVKQHVWPFESIRRFSNSQGVVCLCDKRRDKTRLAKPNDPLFCARRVWDQRAETRYMKRIEDAFQALASRVISGSVTHIDGAQKVVVDAFFALWKVRADWRGVQDGVVPLNGITGEDLSQEQEENLEKNGYRVHAQGWHAEEVPQRPSHAV